MKVILTPREINQIVAEHLVAQGTMKNLVPIDCTWRIDTEYFEASQCIYEQEGSDEQVDCL